MHVAHLIKGLGRGGAESLIPQTVRAAGAGFRYSVGYFLPWKDALVDEVRTAGAPVRCFASRSNLALLRQVLRVAAWLREEEVDLVHAHLPLAGVVARLAGRRASVPVVYTEHNLQPRYHPLTRRANALTWGLQAQAIAVSGEVAESIARHIGDRVPVAVVRNGIEVRRPAAPAEVAALRERFGLPPAAPVVGTVAVLRRQKRLDLWLEAARRIVAVHPETRFLVVGDGPLRAELEAATGRLGLEASVRFTGLQDEVQPFLDAMDVYLMSSEFEGLPLALLEAMASGVPVVVTAVGGIPEVVADGRDGLVLPFGDAGALAAAVGSLLVDAERRRSLAEAGRSRVARDFGIARMAGELEGIYARVAAGETA